MSHCSHDVPASVHRSCVEDSIPGDTEREEGRGRERRYHIYTCTCTCIQCCQKVFIMYLWWYEDTSLVHLIHNLIE